ncbi:MAG TPA: hypothetical protein VHC22_16010 [Pirellulales bacterium]|nr:hypothetical protein [Pirellulales bacterium]
MTRMFAAPRPICSSLVLIAVLSATPWAPAAEQSDGNLEPPPGRPVQVTLSIDLLEVSQIQDHDEKFEVEFYLYLTWKDPRLAFDARRAGHQKRLVPIDQLWVPEPELMDDLEVEVQEGHNAHVRADGSVLWRRYYRGTISSNFDLHEFPFDAHRLELRIESTADETGDMVFVAGDCGLCEESGPEAIHTVPHGWRLVGLTTQVNEAKYPRLGETYSRFTFRIEVKRDPHFYWWAIVLPLLPIVATSWSVFWMDPKEFSSQVGVGVTAMLTVVAYRITIDSSLPPLSYMTRMDYFLLVCQVWVFAAFLLSIVVHVCHVQGSELMTGMDYRISQYCRWLPPLALLATCVLLAWLRPGVAMSVLGCALGVLVLACRPTPARVVRWLRIALFPEHSLDAVAADIEAAEVPRRRAA